MVRHCFVLIAFVLSLIDYANSQAIYIQEGNIFKGVFTEVIERVVFIMNDGHWFSMATSHNRTIRVACSDIKQILGKRGYAISDITHVIHNHFAMARLSSGDKKGLFFLSQGGFRGLFGIFIQGTQNYIWFNHKGERIK